MEQDVPPHVMNDEGPVVAPWVCKSALQRSVAKVFYHAGFEEYQPSAIDVATDVASDFFQKIGQTMKSYMEAPKVPISDHEENATSASQWKRAYTEPEAALHTLSSVGTNVEALESYIKDDVERLGTKLTGVHDRLRSMLTEMLRPALADGGEDGSRAFADGSEQFVGGDFAEDIDEDFFGFKELGLDKELGLTTLSVPLHLLQNRMYNAAQAQHPRYVILSRTRTTLTNPSSTEVVTLFAPPLPYPRISSETIMPQIGLVQGFLNEKLTRNNNEPLAEDLELPPKQRPLGNRPRLPASGKIPLPANSSPQKRPHPPGVPGHAKAIKFGPAEPSKKKVKKNSGVAMSAPEGEESAAVDDAAPANPTLSGVDGMTQETTSATDLKNGVDGMAFPGGVGEHAGRASMDEGRPEGAALTNGTTVET